jgi:hypothetical protein
MKRLQQIANDPGRPESERLAARRALEGTEESPRDEKLDRLEAALLAETASPSLDRVGTDSCFEFCARLGWSPGVLDLWHRHQAATQEARFRCLLGMPATGPPDPEDDKRFVLSERLRATVTDSLCRLLYPVRSRTPEEQEALVRDAVELRARGIL